MPTKLPPEVRAKAEALREDGVPNTKIADQLGVSAQTIHTWLGAGPRADGRRTALKMQELHNKAAKLREDGLSNSQIAAELNVRYDTVWRFLGVNPGGVIPGRPGRRISDDVLAAAHELRKQGKSNHRISKELGVAADTITRWLGPTPKALLSRRDYSHLHMHYRAMYLRECGYTIREISEQLDIPRATIGGWVRGYGCYGLPT